MKIQKAFFSFTFVYFSLLIALHAQQPPAIQQLENSQRQIEMQKPQVFNASTNAEAPELYPGENVDVGPQRILKMIPRRKWFEVAADSQYFYTENAYLTDSSKKSTTLFINTIQAKVKPDPFELGPGYFTPSIGFQSQWYNYGLDGDDSGVSHLDFNAQTAGLGGEYLLNEWKFYSELDYTRLLSQGDYREVYHEFVPSVGIDRVFSINNNLAFVINPAVRYHFTEVQALNLAGSDTDDRFDAGVKFSFVWEAMPNKLFLQPYYFVQYTHYPQFSDNTKPETSRNDLLNDVGATLFYQFTKSVAARIFVDYEVQNSDYKTIANTVQFHNFNGGGGLSLDLRF